MQKIKKILFRQPLLSLAAFCFVIAIASPFVFVESTSQAKEETVKTAATSTVTPSEIEEDMQAVQGQTTYNQTATPTPLRQGSEGQASDSTSNTSAPTATSAPQPTSAPQIKTFQVNLSINGSSVGSVTVEEGNNQCDVLARAKDQGKISQLLMKYIDGLGTNGVYQINGIGKENAVWWVYKVNGASPTQGCSFIKANGGDTVEWEYKG